MRALWIMMTSVGMMCLVLGLGSFVYGAVVLEGSQSQPYNFGAMRGSWTRAEYMFAGTIAAALGAGLVTAGVLGMRGDRLREERARQAVAPGSPR